MKLLFYLVAALIVYGSLFPFDFGFSGGPSADLLFSRWDQFTNLGDLISNIALFVPFGYFGVLALKRWQFLLVLLSGSALAVALQVAQLYLASRDPNLQDAVWNLLGIIGGAVAATIPAFQPRTLFETAGERSVVPLLLLASWLCYRWMPFVPSLDWQNVKNSLKPLLLQPELPWPDLLSNTTAWMIVACLWTTALAPRLSIWLLAAMLPVLFGVEILIVSNAVSAANLAGAILGLSIWGVAFHRLPGGTTLLAVVLAITLIVDGFAPFELRPTLASFHWIPFYGFLSGSMLVNIAALFQKFFLYGALLWLARQEGASLGAGIALGLFTTLVVELGQLVLTGHTPEITDPVLVLLIAVSIRAVEQSVLSEKPVKPTAASRRTSAATRSIRR